MSSTDPAPHITPRPDPPVTVRWAVIVLAAGPYVNLITLAVPEWPESPPAGATPGGLGSGLLMLVTAVMLAVFGFGLSAWFVWLAYRGSRAVAVVSLVCFAFAGLALLKGLDALIVVHAVLWAVAFVLLVLPESRRYARRSRDRAPADATLLRGAAAVENPGRLRPPTSGD